MLYLTSLFHTNIKVKSAVTQNGELLITGVDASGRDLFNFYLRVENVAKDIADDDSSDSDISDLDCSVLDLNLPESQTLSDKSGLSAATLQTMQMKVIRKNVAFFNIAAQMVQHGGSNFREDKTNSVGSGFDGVMMRYNA